MPALPYPVQRGLLGRGPLLHPPGSPGALIHPKAGNHADEPVILKHFVNSFRETELRRTLDGAGVTEIALCRAMGHMCVDAASMAA